jgi:hypothetical protein
MAHNIILEVSRDDLDNIYDEFRTHNLKAKINVDLNIKDAINTYLWREGIMNWMLQNVSGMYHIFYMCNDLRGDESPDFYGNSKPWWRQNSQVTLHETIPILFRFEDSSDAMFFKITYVEGK